MDPVRATRARWGSRRTRLIHATAAAPSPSARSRVRGGPTRPPGTDDSTRSRRRPRVAQAVARPVPRLRSKTRRRGGSRLACMLDTTTTSSQPPLADESLRLVGQPAPGNDHHQVRNHPSRCRVALSPVIRPVAGSIRSRGPAGVPGSRGHRGLGLVGAREREEQAGG
jgi:hypothetical protein